MANEQKDDAADALTSAQSPEDGAATMTPSRRMFGLILLASAQLRALERKVPSRRGREHEAGAASKESELCMGWSHG